MSRSSVRGLSSWIGFALAATLAAPSRAAPVPVTGDLGIIFGTAAYVVVPFAGTVDVTGGTATFGAGLFSASNVFQPGPGWQNLITGVVVTVSNGAGSVSAGGASALCPGPLGGSGACVSGGGIGGGIPVAGLFQIKGALALNVPLSVVGRNGELQTNVGGVVVQGAPWTTGVAKITTTGAPMAMAATTGSAMGPLGAPGSTLNLVTPAHVNLVNLTRVPMMMRLRLEFVPEPAPLALLAAGLGALALAARGRRRP